MNTTKTHKILILFAHPALQKSRVNSRLIAGIEKIQGVTFHDLYEHYPEFFIDRDVEQQLLLDHDIIILQHPFYWYSTPAILKEWQDLVLTHGWAYGQEGRALHHKIMFNMVTTGGPEQAYQTDGYNRFTLRQLLAPLEQTAQLCGMQYLPPFAVHGTHLMKPDQVEQHVHDYHRVLRALVAGEVDFTRAMEHSRLNSDLDAIMTGDSHVR